MGVAEGPKCESSHPAVAAAAEASRGAEGASKRSITMGGRATRSRGRKGPSSGSSSGDGGSSNTTLQEGTEGVGKESLGALQEQARVTRSKKGALLKIGAEASEQQGQPQPQQQQQSESNKEASTGRQSRKQYSQQHKQQGKLDWEHEVAQSQRQQQEEQEEEEEEDGEDAQSLDLLETAGTPVGTAVSTTAVAATTAATAAGSDANIWAQAEAGINSPSSSLAHVSSDEDDLLEGEDEEPTGPLPVLSYPLGELAPAGMKSRRSSTASQANMRRHTLGTAGAMAARGRSSRSSVSGALLPAGTGTAAGAVEGTAAAAAAAGGGEQWTRGRGNEATESRWSVLGPPAGTAAAAGASTSEEAAADGDMGPRRSSRWRVGAAAAAAGVAVAVGVSSSHPQDIAYAEAEQGEGVGQHMGLTAFFWAISFFMYQGGSILQFSVHKLPVGQTKASGMSSTFGQFTY